MAQHRAAPATLTREQVVAIVLEHCSRQFPRPCPTWADRFATLGDFLRRTVSVGAPVSYDGELRQWQPTDPVGTTSYYGCPCGTTLCITSEGMPLPTHWQLLAFVKHLHESSARPLREILDDLRLEVEHLALTRDG